MSQENVELARSALNELNRGRVDAVIDLDVEWIAIPGFLPDAQDFHGPAGVRAWFAKVGEALKEVRWEAEEITDTDDGRFVALRLRASGRSSGTEGEFSIFQAWTIRNGKLARLESYLSRREALEAAGLSE
jgi:ketosteroid isomerase-like protein